MPFARFNFDNTYLPCHPAGAKLKVVILYERLTHVSKAVATYLHLMQELSEGVAPDFRLWRIDRALASAFSADAEQDLAVAEVIIMAVNAHQPCPPEFQRWKDGTGHGGGPAPRAIIIMETSGEPVPAVESWSTLLQCAATPIHPEIFVYEPAKGR